MHIAFSSSFKCLQSIVCTQHGSGVNLTFLFVAAVLHGFGASSACDTASAAIGTSRGITSDCERTCGKSLKQLTQTFPQGARVTGQVVDTRVLEARQVRRQRKGVAKQELRDAKLMQGPSITDDMTRAKISTTVLDTYSMSPESQARRVQQCFILIMLCTARAFTRIAIVTHGWKMEPWRLLLQAYSPTNNARLVVMMLEVVSFVLSTAQRRWNGRSRRSRGT